MNQQSLSTEDKADVRRLHQLVADLSSAVNRQQRYLVAVPDTGVRTAALRDNGEITRLLVYLRRSLEMLEQEQREQVKERDGLRAVQHVGAVINSSLDLNQVLNGRSLPAIIVFKGNGGEGGKS